MSEPHVIELWPCDYTARCSAPNCRRSASYTIRVASFFDSVKFCGIVRLIKYATVGPLAQISLPTRTAACVSRWRAYCCYPSHPEYPDTLKHWLCKLLCGFSVREEIAGYGPGWG